MATRTVTITYVPGFPAREWPLPTASTARCCARRRRVLPRAPRLLLRAAVLDGKRRLPLASMPICCCSCSRTTAANIAEYADFLNTFFVDEVPERAFKECPPLHVLGAWHAYLTSRRELFERHMDAGEPQPAAHRACRLAVHGVRASGLQRGPFARASSRR